MATYKMVKLHMKNERRTNGFYASYFLDKWVERVCQCDNMTLVRKSTPGNVVYNAIFNDAKLGLICNSSAFAYFGTRGQSTSDTALSGLQAPMTDFMNRLNADGQLGSEYFFPYKVECDLIIDSDNNLVKSTALQAIGSPFYSIYGFMFTNGGIMGVNGNSIYSMGASPAVIKYSEPNNDPYSFLPNFLSATDDPDVNTVYISDDFVRDANNYMEIRDHVKFIYSDKLARYMNSGFGEIIVVDGQKYLHVGMGYQWLPITDIEHENIEVTAS